MLKLLNSDDWEFDSPTTEIIPIGRYGVDAQYMKTASVLQQELDSIKPVNGVTFIHTLAVGDTEKYGANKNGDGFKEQDNKTAHTGFVTSGRVHRHHDNKDPNKAVGQCKHSAHNDQMSRIELILGLDNEKCGSELHSYALGKPLSVSMGCRVAYDVCSICQHKAPSPKDYCEHAKTAMGRILEDGQHVYVDNPNPKYFEISLVSRPADRCGYAFRKVASDAAAMDRLTSVDLFKAAGLWVPAAIAAEEAGDSVGRKFKVLSKLAEIEKEIQVELTPVDQALAQSSPDRLLSDQQIEQVHQKGTAGLEQLFGGANEAKVLLPLADFLRLINGGKNFDADDVEPAVEQQLPGIFGRMMDKDPMCGCQNKAFDVMGGPGPDSLIGRMISRMINDGGMGDQQLDRRVRLMIIKRASHPKPRTVPGIYRSDLLINGLADLYATYKLAFTSMEQCHQDPVLLRATVTGNYR